MREAIAKDAELETVVKSAISFPSAAKGLSAVEDVNLHFR